MPGSRCISESTGPSHTEFLTPPPLTAVAARYTDDRRANFDIYLPEWLARYNKQIFGPLYAMGVAYLVAMVLSAGSD